MFLRKILTCLALLLFGGFGMGCDDASLESAKVNVDDALANYAALDTSGLLGTKILGFVYCKNMKDFFKEKEHPNAFGGFYEVSPDSWKLIHERIENFIHSDLYGRISKRKQECFSQAIRLEARITLPQEGPYCDGYESEIDTMYIRAMIFDYENKKKQFQEDLEFYNKRIDDCDKKKFFF